MVASVVSDTSKSSNEVVSANHLFEQARSLFHKNALLPSWMQCQSIVSSFPDYAKAYNLMGLIKKAEGDLASAAQYIEKAIALDGREAKFLFNLSHVYKETGSVDKAIEALLNAIDISPNFVEAHANLGNLYLKADQKGEAAKCYEHALAINPALDNIRHDLLNIYCEVKEMAGLPHGAYLVEHFSENTDYWLSYIHYLSVIGKEEEIATIVDEGIELSSDPIALLRMHASVYMKRKSYDNAKKILDAAVTRFPDNAYLYHDLATLHLALSDLDSAEAAFQKAFDLDPSDTENASAFASFLRAAGKFDRAIQVIDAMVEVSKDSSKALLMAGKFYINHYEYQKAIRTLKQSLKMDPDSLEALSSLGEAFLSLDKEVKAGKVYARILEIDPEYVPAIIGMAITYNRMTRIARARDLLDRALALDPENKNVLLANALFCFENGEYEESERCYDKVLEKPGIEKRRALSGKAILFEHTKRFQEAYDLFQTLSDEIKSAPNLALSYAVVCYRLGYKDKAISILEETLELPMNDTVRASILYRLGEFCDKEKDFDKSFSYYQKGADIKNMRHHPRLDADRISLMIECMSKEKMAEMPRSAHGGERQVFIVGMPRSGTSLTEQIIHSHSEGVGAGELSYVPNIVKNLPQLCGTPKKIYPVCMPFVTQKALDVAASQYIGILRDQYPDAQRIVDKMPHNFMNVGLIALLFPKAKIIHTRRHPLDTCLSCYFQNFTRGHPYSYTLDNVAHHYKEYLRMMQHWRDVGIEMLEVDYDLLVHDPEPHVRAILEHIGLPWEEQCLEFHKSKRVVRTASYDQVRQPLYTKSAGRWKNYEKHIQPMLDILGPVDTDYTPGTIWQVPEIND